jgi:hypothetical protein
MGEWVDEETGWVPGQSVLVERFAVDGSVAVSFDFMHINKIIA